MQIEIEVSERSLRLTFVWKIEHAGFLLKKLPAPPPDTHSYLARRLYSARAPSERTLRAAA